MRAGSGIRSWLRRKISFLGDDRSPSRFSSEMERRQTRSSNQGLLCACARLDCRPKPEQPEGPVRGCGTGVLRVFEGKELRFANF